ncbi:MAG: phage holin family protein [Planctomycetaceae bacterium]
MSEHPDAPPPAAETERIPRPGKSLGQLAADFLTLVELQMELAQADCSEAMKKARMPSFLICVAIACAIGSCPLAMLGLAWWLADVAGLSIAVSALLVALIGLAAAAGLFYVAWKQFRSSAALFRRSTDELRENVSWIKHVFANRQP